ncbi:MAG: TraR/DksA family transcriptional regulator, partial [Elusimicrobiota bacterium]
VSQEVGDEADQAGQSLEKELIFEVSDNERLALDQIEGALRKMDKGTYGLCESCQKPIPKIRLKAVPFARYCIGCQTSAERAVLT